jgi:hypothetical protein
VSENLAVRGYSHLLQNFAVPIWKSKRENNFVTLEMMAEH